MPPTSYVRTKTAAAPGTLTHVNDPNAPPRRTTSGRAVRANTTRPTNYYARPSASAQNLPHSDGENGVAAPGFFPAITFFTDAITALPKEVMRQFTFIKEVEAKIYANNEKLGEVVDEVMAYPVPSKAASTALLSGGESGTGGPVHQAMLSLTANNSVTGSVAPSVVNGVAPNVPAQHSAQASVAGSWHGEEMIGQAEEDMTKRQKYHELRQLIAATLPNLDEKGVVLSEANRILRRQHTRIASVMPHLEEEISEEARLGSMRHWAYSDNRQRKSVAGANANRRDVTGTNSLVAAANAVHESDIAAARSAAVREGREKPKGRQKEPVDSDFDDRPKKTKAAKGKLAPSAGLGILGAVEPVKKRKLDKGLAAPGMERSISTKGAKSAAKEASRSTPGAEPLRKPKSKPPPLPAKRKGLGSAHASPALASSPLHSSFTVATMEPPGTRPSGNRARQSSNATNLRHEKIAGEEASRPTSAPSKSNGTSKRKAIDEDEETQAKKTTEMGEDAEPRGERPTAPRSGSNSGKAGRGSAVGTPRTEGFPDGIAGPAALKRTRSTRSARDRDDSSSGTGAHHRHRRQNSHLVKQLASFNRSPDMDRDRDDMDDDLDSLDGRREGEDEDTRSPRKRPMSRRNTQLPLAITASPPPILNEREDALMDDVPATSPPASDNDAEVDAGRPLRAPSPTRSNTPLSPAAHSDPPSSLLDPRSPSPRNPSAYDDIDIEDDDDEEGDPDDPDEPKYCYCNRGSYGEMIACDNNSCPKEWFHLGCTGLSVAPAPQQKWYCRDCEPLFADSVKGRGGRPRGRGRG